MVQLSESFFGKIKNGSKMTEADNYIDNLLDRAWNYRSPRKRKKTYQSGSGNYKWKTSSGVIEMKKMTTEHLKNAIDICHKTGNIGKRIQLEEILASRVS